MAKFVEKLGKFENFQAPWEHDGEEDEIDKADLKKHIFNLMKDKATAQDARDAARAEATEAKTELEAKVATLEKDLAAADSTGKVAELQAELDKVKSDLATSEARATRSEVIASLGLDAEGVKKVEKYLRADGSKEELEENAAEIVEDFGLGQGGGDDDDDDIDDLPSRRGASRLVNPGDETGGGGAADDFYRAAEDIMGGNVRL